MHNEFKCFDSIEMKYIQYLSTKNAGWNANKQPYKLEKRAYDIQQIPNVKIQ